MSPVATSLPLPVSPVATSLPLLVSPVATSLPLLTALARSEKTTGRQHGALRGGRCSLLGGGVPLRGARAGAARLETAAQKGPRPSQVRHVLNIAADTSHLIKSLNARQSYTD